MRGTKDEVAKILNLKNPDSVKHYHRKWVNGVHFYKRPGGKRSGYGYNIPLIKHWIQCHENLESRDHVRAMADYQMTLNSKKIKWD